MLKEGCFALACRTFFELAEYSAQEEPGERTGTIYPIALEAVERLDALFDIEREINGLSAEARHAVHQERSAALMEALHAWLNAQLSNLSRNYDLAKAINYMLRRWPAFSRFLEDGRVCVTNNAAERRGGLAITFSNGLDVPTTMIELLRGQSPTSFLPCWK